MSQKKAKFNIVDLIVLLVLAAGIAFVALRMFGSSAAPAEADPVTGSTFHVTFYAECVPEDVAASLVQGSRCENAARNMDLGRLIDFSTGDSVYYAVDDSGECVRSVKPGHVSVTMTMELTGIQQPTGLQVGDFLLNIGHEMGVCAGNTEIGAIVWDIRSTG